MPRSETAFAKINLALHVRRRRADGYHEIETIFAFAADGDVVALDEGPPGLTITGPFAHGLSAGADNLVRRAAAALGEDVALTLDKRLPVAAGIGGGSADAAAAMRLLRPGSPPDAPALQAIAAGLGADVPACLIATTAWADGLGYPVRPIAAAGLAGMPLLLVNPGVSCPTGPVFAGWDGIDRGPLADGDPLAAAIAGRNDLEAPALRLVPAIGAVLALLRSTPGAALVRMSGSGATCFALFDRMSDRDACAHAATRDGWWSLGTVLR